MLKRMLARARYRIWQFKQVLWPKFDPDKWRQATAQIDPALTAKLDGLKKSEKAHILRVYDDISRAVDLDDEQRRSLLEMALLHDIGKAVTRPSLFFKVAKVIFAFANTGHCIAGARLLWRHRQNRQLVRRVLRHHDVNPDDKILRLFQRFDDRN